MRVIAELYPDRLVWDVDLPNGSRGNDLFRVLDLAPDVHILVRGDAPVPIDEELRDGERVRVISVVSGGAGVDTRP